MPKPVDYDLSQISAHIITYSDRIQRQPPPVGQRWPRLASAR